jgi:type IV pilus assembly protein PilE
MNWHQYTGNVSPIDSCGSRAGSGTLTQRQLGFTLIELMVVISILGLLLAIAIPGYSDYLTKARRSDARAALLEIASAQERHYFQNRQYSSDGTDLWSHPDGLVSADGYYTLSFAFIDDDNQTYRVTATARGQQSGDADCTSLSYDNTGSKDSTGAADSSVCW